MEHYYLDRLSRQFGFHRDVSADLDFDNRLDPEIMLCCHHMLTRCGTGSQDEGKLGSKPQLKIARSGKPLEPFILLMEDGSSPVKIPGIDVVISLPPIPAILIQSITSLSQSYTGQTSAKEQDSCRMEVQGKLDKASRWLNTEGAHYEAKVAVLKQVKSRREEQLKELQFLEDQKKDIGSQVAANEHLLQETELEVNDFQG
ncbi:hypothetical protein Cgig2_003844 [Carnegiea gigantea]|uniref:Uncharacterized protein n=1 Tax=Carnegiea gigantea TaxID=171969 RepID=A0A9Q1GIF7_9CARY|nr:hypothetical protein Cgig2_003844 [Carnegiea gigantea]